MRYICPTTVTDTIELGPPQLCDSEPQRRAFHTVLIQVKSVIKRNIVLIFNLLYIRYLNHSSIFKYGKYFSILSAATIRHWKHTVFFHRFYTSEVFIYIPLNAWSQSTWTEHLWASRKNAKSLKRKWRSPQHTLQLHVFYNNSTKARHHGFCSFYARPAAVMWS